MQTIYVDVLVFTNIFITYFLLLTVHKILKVKIHTANIIFGSIVGGLSSLVALLPQLNAFLTILLKAVVCFIIVFISFRKCNLKQFITRVFAFAIATFGFGGIMILLYSLLKPQKLIIYNDVIYIHISPLFLIGSTVICYLIIRIYKNIVGHSLAKNKIYNITVYSKGNRYDFDGKIDTGCNLTEPFSGDEVIIAEKELFKHLENDERNMRIIPYKSLGGSGIIKGFRADSVYIDNKKLNKEIYIGLCENILNGETKALINSNIIDSEEFICK